MTETKRRVIGGAFFLTLLGILLVPLPAGWRAVEIGYPTLFWTHAAATWLAHAVPPLGLIALAGWLTDRFWWAFLDTGPRTPAEWVMQAHREMLVRAVQSHRAKGSPQDIGSMLSELRTLSDRVEPVAREEWDVRPYILTFGNGILDDIPFAPEMVPGVWNVSYSVTGKSRGNWGTGWTVTLKADSVVPWDDPDTLRKQLGG